MKVGREGEMEKLNVTPDLIQELQQFEEKKSIYMIHRGSKQTKENKHQNQTKKGFQYYFKHPTVRLLVPCVVTILNVYQFANDPISLSVTDCHIAGFGNIYSLIFTNYPFNGVSILKCILWVFGIIFGIAFGKIFIHNWLFCKKLRLKIFTTEGQGSWLVILLVTCCILFFQASVYNSFLTLMGSDYMDFICTSNLHIENKSFMKGAALFAWIGNFFTVWMILDTMLQEQKYTHWLRWVRAWWSNGIQRVLLFWFTCLTFGIVMVTGITTNFINWNVINKSFYPTNELSRSFLASTILVLDLVILMQDWDFPHFSSLTNLKLPGIPMKSFSINLPPFLSMETQKIHIHGKWVNYSVLLSVMVLDLYQWKNQIYYQPQDYGQYTDTEGWVHTINDRNLLQTMMTSNKSRITFDQQNRTNDVISNMKFLNYSIAKRGAAFLPVIIAFLVFVYITKKYSKEESDAEKMVRNWYTSKFVKKLKNRKVVPVTTNEDSEDEDVSIPLITKQNTSKFTYFYQHPNIRLLTIITSMYLSSLIIAVDPISQSYELAKVDIIGNIQNLIFEKYPEKVEYWILKVSMWVFACLFGGLIGKYFVHQFILQRILKLQLLKRNRGSWTIMLFTTMFMLYCFSLLFNYIGKLDNELKPFQITREMGIRYKTFMNGVGLVSFFTHLIFSMMVTDTILQEEHYIHWVKMLRRIWKKTLVRLCISWIFAATVGVIAIAAIVFNIFESIQFTGYPTNELERACLAAAVIMFDIVIITQDWEFPRFKINPKIKLPGLNAPKYQIDLCFFTFDINGRWFSYSLLGIVLLFDCYNFKNALTYTPDAYNQYIDENFYIIDYMTNRGKMLAAMTNDNFNCTHSTNITWNCTNSTNIAWENLNIANNGITTNTSIIPNNVVVWETEKLNAKFQNINADVIYGTSLTLPIFAFVFSVIFGFIRSHVMKDLERKMQLQKQLANVPKIEDIKINYTTGIRLKPLGNIKTEKYNR